MIVEISQAPQAMLTRLKKLVCSILILQATQWPITTMKYWSISWGWRCSPDNFCGWRCESCDNTLCNIFWQAPSPWQQPLRLMHLKLKLVHTVFSWRDLYISILKSCRPCTQTITTPTKPWSISSSDSCLAKSKETATEAQDPCLLCLPASPFYICISSNSTLSK